MDLTVNHASLDGASSDLATGANNIQSALDSMDADLRLLLTQWDGEAQEAYQVAKQQWTEGMNGMREVLAQISQFVEQANQGYRSVDASNAARFQ